MEFLEDSLLVIALLAGLAFAWWAFSGRRNRIKK